MNRLRIGKAAKLIGRISILSISGGYYTVKIKPGFRVISLNTNYCTRLNPWTLYDPVDPGNQLKWLVKELHSAELANEKVHILGHIPPDNRECR